MSARREHRLRALEKRVKRLEEMAHPPVEDCHFGIVTPPGAMDAPFRVISVPAPRKGLFQRIKEAFTRWKER